MTQKLLLLLFFLLLLLQRPHLAEQREARVVVLRAEVLDLSFAARLLAAKLVGGERKDLEAVGVILVVDRLEACWDLGFE